MSPQIGYRARFVACRAQPFGLFQRCLHFQPLRQFPHVVVPLRGGQGIQLRQCLPVAIAAGEV
ncbi:hypothetical protein D3C79_910240 [compost metagenome]